MDPAHVPAGSIVVGIDGSPSSDKALTWAIEQAALERRALTIVHSLEPLPITETGGMYAMSGIDYGRLMEDGRAAAQALLAAATARALELDPDLTVHEVLGHVDPRITLESLGESAAMIVLGSRGRGPVSSLLLGSVGVAVSKRAACPVVVHRPRSTDASTHGILVGVDGTTDSVPAIDFAYRMASWRVLPLTVLHCYWDGTPVAPLPGTEMPDDSSEQAVVAESLAGMQEKFPEVEVRVRLVRGFSDQHLMAASPTCDLLVVGHHPVSAMTDLVRGSVAPAVVEQAHCPVAVVPSPRSLSGHDGA